MAINKSRQNRRIAQVNDYCTIRYVHGWTHSLPLSAVIHDGYLVDEGASIIVTLSMVNNCHCPFSLITTQVNIPCFCFRVLPSTFTSPLKPQPICTIAKSGLTYFTSTLSVVQTLFLKVD